MGKSWHGTYISLEMPMGEKMIANSPTDTAKAMGGAVLKPLQIGSEATPMPCSGYRSPRKENVTAAGS